MTANRESQLDPEDAASRLRDLIEKRRQGKANPQELIDIAVEESKGRLRGVDVTAVDAVALAEKVAAVVVSQPLTLEEVTETSTRIGLKSYRVSFGFMVLRPTQSPWGAVMGNRPGRVSVSFMHTKSSGVYDVVGRADIS